MKCENCGCEEFEVTVQTTLFVYPILRPGAQVEKEVYGEKEQVKVFSAAFCARCGVHLSPAELTALIKKL